MATAGNDRSFHVYSPYTQQKYSNVPCFWETQPSGCLRIRCAFHHSKPRLINGLFLPPSNILSKRSSCLPGVLVDGWNLEQDAPLQQGVQEEILHPARLQKSLRNQENVAIPIHPPLIINLSDEEDDEEDNEEEENYVSNWVPKSASDIEEEKAIKEICHKSGEYYKIQHPREHQSTRPMSSPREHELSPLEGVKQDLQKGDGNTIPTKYKNTKGAGDSSGSRGPTESVPRTSCRSFENRGTKHRGKEVKQKKQISEEPRNSPKAATGKGIPTSDPSVKPRYQSRGQRKDEETASSMTHVRETGKKAYFSFSEPRRSAYIVYRSVTVTQDPKFKGSTAGPEPYSGKYSTQQNRLDTNRRFWTQTENYDKYTYNAPPWRTKNPQTKTFSNFKTTIQRQEDMEVSRTGERYLERRERRREYFV